MNNETARALVQGPGGDLVCVPYNGFWMSIALGDFNFKYTWNPGPPPQGGSYSTDLSDLVLLAFAYGTSGNGHAVPFTLGGVNGVWEPGCDVAPPAGKVSLSDLVTLALHINHQWGANP